MWHGPVVTTLSAGKQEEWNMNRSGVILTICAGILLAAVYACGDAVQEAVEETEVIETPAVAVTNGTAAGNERAAVVPPEVAAPTSPAAPTPTAFALTVPPPKIVTATPVASVDVEQVDCGVFESAEDAQAYFLTEGGGPSTTRTLLTPTGTE